MKFILEIDFGDNSFDEFNPGVRNWQATNRETARLLKIARKRVRDGFCGGNPAPGLYDSYGRRVGSFNFSPEY